MLLYGATAAQIYKNNGRDKDEQAKAAERAARAAVENILPSSLHTGTEANKIVIDAHDRAKKTEAELTNELDKAKEMAVVAGKTAATNALKYFRTIVPTLNTDFLMGSRTDLLEVAVGGLPEEELKELILFKKKRYNVASVASCIEAGLAAALQIKNVNGDLDAQVEAAFWRHN